jgi:type IV pilus assembly protein PilW
MKQHFHLRNSGASSHRQRGVSLIELLVGMLVGLLAVLIISQVLLASEGQKRTTTGGADAQVNGALALHAIQRDVEQAGYGLTSSPQAIGCPISASYGGSTPAGFATTLAPVFITPESARPVGSVGDAVRVLASSKDSFSVPGRVIAPNYAPGSAEFNVRSTVGYAEDDLALVVTDATQPCSVFQVTGTPSATMLPRDTNTTWNGVGEPSVPYVDGAVMINLGRLIDNRYEIFNGTDADGQVKRNLLRVSSFNVNNPAVRVTQDLQPDIVNLRAFYGRDTSAIPDGIVDMYDTVTPTTNAGWLRVLSVRVVVVARSSTYEKKETRSDGTDVYATPTNPEWPVGSTPGVAGAVTCSSGAGSCLVMDVGAGVAGDVPAKHYRYKTFDTVIPLRNMLWRNPTP